MGEYDFQHELVRGRIAETVFELMFRESSGFDVLPLGYEHTMPELVQYRNHKGELNSEIIGKVLDNFHDCPDFMLVEGNKSKMYLVEVKYQGKFDPGRLLKIAEDISSKWHPVMLFVATPEHFYYDSCTNIKNNKGIPAPLLHDLIPEDKQKYYLDLLNRFEK